MYRKGTLFPSHILMNKKAIITFCTYNLRNYKFTIAVITMSLTHLLHSCSLSGVTQAMMWPEVDYIREGKRVFISPFSVS